MLTFIGEYTGINFVIVSIAFVLTVLLSLSLHEFAHAYVAYKCGDSTPKMQGRITLNPLKHIDAMGFLSCVFFSFGWAKPVQINPGNFRNIKKGTTLTSLAGVTMNFLLAFLSCGIFKLISLSTANNFMVHFFLCFFYFMFSINVCLAVFNILPIYPLDGFKVVENYTKYNNAYVQFMYKYGSIILLCVLLFLQRFLSIIINFISTPILMFWELIF